MSKIASRLREVLETLSQAKSAIRNVARSIFKTFLAGFSLFPALIEFSVRNEFVVLSLCEILAKIKQVYWGLFLSCTLVTIYRKGQRRSNFAEYYPTIRVWQISVLFPRNQSTLRKSKEITNKIQILKTKHVE